MTNITFQKTRNYDPHLLYQALNMTAELRYRIPMQTIYNLLEDTEKKGKDVNPDQILDLLNTLQKSLDEKLSKKNEDDLIDSDSNTEKTERDRIKELLQLLHCSVSNKDLNRILKGELSIDDVLSEKTKVLWKLVFDQKIGERPIANNELINNMSWCVQKLEYEAIEEEAQRNMIEKRNLIKTKGFDLAKMGNFKTFFTLEQKKEKYHQQEDIEEKRKKLRLYIGHMQGYDRDRDGNGMRGMDMSTGYIVDFGDVYIADKEHGAIIEDRDHDGIDIEDIK